MNPLVNIPRLNNFKPGRPVRSSLRLVEDANRLAEVKSTGMFTLSGEGSLPKFNWVVSSVQSNSSTVRWNVRSDGRRSRSIQYLFNKWLFSELTKEEFQLFLEIPEILKDPLIYSCLLATRKYGLSKKKLRIFLKKIGPLLFIDRKLPSLERWNGYKTYRLILSRDVIHLAQNNIKKYSGWKRHHNDQGSLSPSSREDPFPLEPISEDDIASTFLELMKEYELGSTEIIINNKRIRL